MNKLNNIVKIINSSKDIWFTDKAPFNVISVEMKENDNEKYDHTLITLHFIKESVIVVLNTKNGYVTDNIRHSAVNYGVYKMLDNIYKDFYNKKD